jgi:hypothetical protein
MAAGIPTNRTMQIPLTVNAMPDFALGLLCIFFSLSIGKTSRLGGNSSGSTPIRQADPPQ